ncbi:MAG: apolipoprotein N-acyltransferase [Acidimicrobiales bacterium]
MSTEMPTAPGPASSQPAPEPALIDECGAERTTPGRRRVAGLRRGRVALPAVASGVGLALSLPPWGFWILAFPAAGLLWWRLGGLAPRTRLWAGWLAGLGLYLPGLMWAKSFTLAGAAVLIALEALFVGLACLAVPSGPVVARALAFPATMTLAEAVRTTWPFGGLPLGGVFLGQAGGPLLGLARVGGPLALNGAVYVGGVGLAAVAGGIWRTGRSRHSRPDRDRVRAWFGIGVVALCGTLAAGVAGGLAPGGGPPVGRLTTAAVQGGGRRGFSKSQIPTSVVLGAQLAADRLMVREDHGHNPRLVLWPEDVVSLPTVLSDSPEKQALSRLARSLDSTLVVGVTEDISATAFRNEAVAWGPDGRLVAHYEKVHRVPFGEYVPYRGFFSHLVSLSAVPRDAVPGTGSGLMRTPAAPLGTMISYEVFYSSRGRSAVRAGAQLLIVPTNTSSYAASQVPTQEVAAARIQAVEQGRDLLLAAPTGYSAAIDHRGQVLDRSVLGKRQVVFATLSLRKEWTIFVRFGDVPALVLSGLGLVTGWVVALVTDRRSTGDDAVLS